MTDNNYETIPTHVPDVPRRRGRRDGKKQADLNSAAKGCVSQHTRLVYTQLPVYWQYTDVYPDLVDGYKRWWEMYSDDVYLLRGEALSSFSSYRMQREHAIPKSWWKKNGDVEYTPAYSDLWNLYPSNGRANQAKLNYAFGVCKSTTFDNGVTKVGPAATGYGGGSGNVFEPGDEYKGDFARTIFYMATVYDDLPWVINYMFSANSPYPTLRPWAVDMLLNWARQDPVSQKEVERNDAVQNAQGNRNPYIDFPELAEYVWGTRQNEVFRISEQGGQVTPPVTGDPEITEPVNDEALDFGEVAVGQSTGAQLRVSGANLTAPLSVRVTGDDRAMFTVSARSIPALDINRGNAYLLNVIYTPTATGTHHANLTLYDGGLPLGHEINVRLIGQAFPVPTLTTLMATAATDLSDDAYTANWSAAPEVVDYYVVTRVRYEEGNTESEELTSDVNSLRITGRTPGVMESYTVCSSRLGYRSEPSNSITVSSTGIVGVEAPQPLTIGSVEGGFTVMLDERHTNLCVYDISGKTVLHVPAVEGGETFMLPQGIYLVRDDQCPQPRKITVF